MVSPAFRYPWVFACLMAKSRRARSLGSPLYRIGMTPQFMDSLRATAAEDVIARIGISGRYFEISREVKPVSVRLIIAAAFRFVDMLTAAWLMASVTILEGCGLILCK